MDTTPDTLEPMYSCRTTPTTTMSPSAGEENPTLLQRLNDGITPNASTNFFFENDDGDIYGVSSYRSGDTADLLDSQIPVELPGSGTDEDLEPSISNTGSASNYGDWTPEEDVSPIKRCRTDSPAEGSLTAGEPPQENGVEDSADMGSSSSPLPASVSIDGKGGRSKRHRKKSTQEGRVHLCPVCGITLRPGELATHLSMERVKVDRITRPGKKSGIRGAGLHAGKVQPTSSSGAISGGGGGDGSDSGDGSAQSDPAERYQSYLRIKEARQARLCARSQKKKRDGEETVCPVCNKKVSGTPEELNEHVDICLRTREAEDAITVDVEGDNGYEEYEWAGQTRIRTSTLLPGGLGASGFPTITKTTAEDDDLDLDVDGDDEDSYGQPQYSERDVIPCTLDEPWENKERLALRKAFIKTELQSVESEPTDRTRWGVNPSKGKSKSRYKAYSASCSSAPQISGEERGEVEDELASDSISTSEEVINCLKERIREQEKLLGQDRPKCLICMEPHHLPVTSIQCWHVHCEECWLRTLGAKKVCPQCNMITSSTDLRRIYL